MSHTAPYGHNGAYNTLEGIISHHADNLVGFKTWDRTELLLPDLKELNEQDFLITADKQEQQRLKSSMSIAPRALSKTDINALVAFMSSLTDEKSLYGRPGIPDSVPSNLSVDP